MSRLTSTLLSGVAVLVVSAGLAGTAAAGTTAGGTTSPTSGTPQMTQTPDPVLTKLNQIQADLDAATTKLLAVTAKLDAQTAKVDAQTVKLDWLKARTDVVYDTTLYTKGAVLGGVSGLMDQLRRTCGVADEGRDLAAYAALDSWNYAHNWNCS